jgi:integrase
MPLKCVRRHGSPFIYVRGSVRGQSVDETTGTQDEAAAEAYRIAREGELLNRSLLGEKAPRPFANAGLSYIEAAGLSGRDEMYVIRLSEFFVGKTLTQIGPEEIERAVQRFCPKAGPATINRTVIGPLAAVLHHAGDRRRIARRKAPKGRTRWLTHDDADILIAACQPKFRARDASLAPLVEFLFFTGCRIGEALTLDWSEVDLARHHVVFRDTKNGEDRGIPLHTRALAVLANMPHRRGRVFRRPDGLPYSPRNGGGGHVKTAFNAACRRAGIADFTPHDCRHTWATWFYTENRDVRALMELGGWKTLSQVQRYTHVNKEHLRASVNRLGEKTGTAPATPEEKKAVSA